MKYAILVAFIALLLLVGVSGSVVAQEGPPPDELTGEGVPLSQVERLELPPVDVQRLQVEDKQRADRNLPPRFAQPVAVEVSPDTHGTWEQIDPDTRLWRLRVASPGAISLNLGFEHYNMPDKGRLFIYTPDYATVVGPFTAQDNEDHGQLWTPLLPGDEVVIELSLPTAAVAQLDLELTTVNHGYAEFGRLNQKSGSCHVDIACDEAQGWHDEVRAVAAYSVGGSIFCSGALVNNTARDLKPYFLTAYHCGIRPGNAPSVVVYWNYQNSTCRPPGSVASGEPGDGLLEQFNTGAIYRAGYDPSDFALLELDDPVERTVNAFWAGWDSTTTTPSEVITIHHPAGEEKRISFGGNTSITAFSSEESPGDSTHLRVAGWGLGSTAASSSGAPLFDLEQRIIGQLNGGDAACGVDGADWYGRLLVSWEGGGTDDTRLKNWLDPADTAERVLDGLDANLFFLRAEPASLDVCIPDNAQYTVDVSANSDFADPVTLAVAGLPEGANARFSTNPLVPSADTALLIGDLEAAQPGSYTLQVTGSANDSPFIGAVPGDTISTDISLTVLDRVPAAPLPASPAHRSIGVSLAPTLVWEADAQSRTYVVEIDDDPAFESIDYTVSVSETTHTVTTELAASTRYYWRVTAQNACGVGEVSTPAVFKTVDYICTSPALAIPDGPNPFFGGSPTPVTDTLVISATGPLVDLNVFVDASHTYVADLSFELEHIAANTGSVTRTTLIDRPGLPDPPFQVGCNGQNIAALLDDEAALPVNDECEVLEPVSMAGSLTPEQPLSVFDGRDLSGTWNIVATDSNQLDTGTLNSWCLVPTLPDVELALTKTVNQDIIAPGEVVNYTLVVSNTGLSDATNITLTDDMPEALKLAGDVTLTDSSGNVTILQPELPVLSDDLSIAASEQVTVTIPVRLIPGRVDAPVIENTATASSPAAPEPVSDTASLEVFTTPDVYLRVLPDKRIVWSGDTVTYVYSVVNTGNVALVDVATVDRRLGDVPLDKTRLEPGERTSGTMVYKTERSILPRLIVNVATVSALSVSGGPVSDSAVAWVWSRGLIGRLLPLIITGSAVEVGATRATISSLVTPTDTATTVTIRWGTSRGGPYTHTRDVGTFSGSESQVVDVQIPGLQPETTYYYVAEATSSTGIVRGEEQQFTTHASKQTHSESQIFIPLIVK